MFRIFYAQNFKKRKRGETLLFLQGEESFAANHVKALLKKLRKGHKMLASLTCMLSSLRSDGTPRLLSDPKPSLGRWRWWAQHCSSLVLSCPSLSCTPIPAPPARFCGSESNMFDLSMLSTSQGPIEGDIHKDHNLCILLLYKGKKKNMFFFILNNKF